MTRSLAMTDGRKEKKAGDGESCLPACQPFKDCNGSDLRWISTGFGFCEFRFGIGFSPWFSGSGPRNHSGSVLGLVFHPWISNGYPK